MAEAPRHDVRRVVVLGSTGSVGTQALDVVRNHRDRYEVVALAAGRNVELLEAQRAEFGVDPECARACADDPDLLAALAAHPDADVVLNAVVGFAGLPATIAALRNGKRLALANKESLIAGGPVVANARARGSGEIVPVDSEHSALYQALRCGTSAEVRRLVLTASGGPFRGYTREELVFVTVADALKHPTWDMGAKITVDSSTLMNKGLEVIEAHELFGVGFDRIDVVVHPQSVVHGMVEFVDGATLAQLSMPDMRLPIGLALGAPARLDEPFGTIDWTTLSELTFEPPDVDAFPCLALAYEAGRTGGSAPAVLSGANEVAVDAFLAGRIPWTAIGAVVAEALAGGTGNVLEVEDVLDADRVARERATATVERHGRAA
ncbi:MAG TPA: 1-deoxy-D-xylulose-5-phosphate reductoisomerase [Acidimicrobiia bacterium]|nr:1-deoxy-D-xylulose-5-phosphate reductoisomerase [Acidimicrobiia bacterium]